MSLFSLLFFVFMASCQAEQTLKDDLSQIDTSQEPAKTEPQAVKSPQEPPLKEALKTSPTQDPTPSMADAFIQKHQTKQHGISFVLGEGPVKLVVFSSPACEGCQNEFKTLSSSFVARKNGSVLFVFFPIDVVNLKINMILRAIQEDVGGDWASKAFARLLSHTTWISPSREKTLDQACQQILEVCQPLDQKAIQKIVEIMESLKTHDKKKLQDVLENQPLAEETFKVYKAYKDQFGIQDVPMVLLNADGQLSKAKDSDYKMIKDLERKSVKDADQKTVVKNSQEDTATQDSPQPEPEPKTLSQEIPQKSVAPEQQIPQTEPQPNSEKK